MKKNQAVLPIILIAILFLALAAEMALRVWIPAIVLPKLNLPNMVLLSALALLLEGFIAPRARRCYLQIALFSFAAFALLPCMAGYAWESALFTGLFGMLVFVVVTFVVTSLRERVASGPSAQAAPFVGTLLLYLAAQCFSGMLF